LAKMAMKFLYLYSEDELNDNGKHLACVGCFKDFLYHMTKTISAEDDCSPDDNCCMDWKGPTTNSGCPIVSGSENGV
jgi:hypothetical protein